MCCILFIVASSEQDRSIWTFKLKFYTILDSYLYFYLSNFLISAEITAFSDCNEEFVTLNKEILVFLLTMW